MFHANAICNSTCVLVNTSSLFLLLIFSFLCCLILDVAAGFVIPVTPVQVIAWKDLLVPEMSNVTGNGRTGWVKNSAALFCKVVINKLRSNVKNEMMLIFSADLINRPTPKVASRKIK